ncbi:Clavaminate synthase-like protein [Gloeophyllum trabeum ATCC 11539]|uniref:Clavaminate synthase-like protein n=1 Tax=Gloeophyllum trabeum (strain ATCC 11539 / FP-39264 / Madison 617) TaxID=670483 RepID=S7QF50_GLOTA|nr:Clavaminate synthase-like protein [Gloeophyllum trabeum ATCC 11539]EPQ57953.1 Clavaminate synthase-like protein [Gloeophyllum trabeum ATCC 11539]
MSTTTTLTSTLQTTQLQLRTAYGPVYRTVSTAPPRDCTPDEVPIIDLTGIYGDLDERLRVAAQVCKAAQDIGFFYIRNHGIEEDIIERARKQLVKFFEQPLEAKELVSGQRSKYFNGYVPSGVSHASPLESKDDRESFSWRYSPEYDPEPKDLNAIPPEVNAYVRGEEFVWEGTTHMPDFKEDVLRYWQACLTLSRRLVRIFALALDLPEDYFDKVTTYPGADGVFNFYRGLTPEAIEATKDQVGIGSHTDLQCFTLLWQDMNGGLQVLKGREWLKVPPIEGTFVVNIGDYLMRLTNDRFLSTVHRASNHSEHDRVSMPFFFGFNFNETCSVLPTCVTESSPAKYEPITCGDWCQLRFQQ